MLGFMGRYHGEPLMLAKVLEEPCSNRSLPSNSRSEDTGLVKNTVGAIWQEVMDYLPQISDMTDPAPVGRPAIALQ